MLLSAAFAQDAVSLQVVRNAQLGSGLPRLTVIANADTTRLAVDLRCGATDASAEGAPKAGGRLDVDIPLSAPGPATCAGELAVALADGSEGTMPLQFDVNLLAPIEITVARDAVDIDARTLSLATSRPANITVTASGLDGELGQGSFGGAPAGEPVTLSWQQPDGAEVVRLHVRAEDGDGFWSALDLFPWFYAIPHEDVVFASNQSDVRDSEARKLTDAMTEISGVTAKYGQHAEVNLYVAGYTDSVGAAGANKALSERRARAIAAWFRAAGFSGTIYYQGFGEAGLLVPSGDEVDEPRNRRAAYIVAAEAPPESPQMPGSRWTKL